eukprot:scaffold7982_cov110-Isochrysis_galbana.AAC.1
MGRTGGVCRVWREVSLLHLERSRDLVHLEIGWGRVFRIEDVEDGGGVGSGSCHAATEGSPRLVNQRGGAPRLGDQHLRGRGGGSVGVHL